MSRAVPAGTVRVMPSRALPPPPPPVRLRAWPDRQTLLTDRGMALDELRRAYLAAHRLLLLWLCAFGGVIGWALLVQPFQLIEDKDPLTFVFGPVFVILGLAALAPAVVGVVLGMRRDRHIRELTDAWAALDTDPAADARLRSPAPVSPGACRHSWCARSACGHLSARPRTPNRGGTRTWMSPSAWARASSSG